MKAASDATGVAFASTLEYIKKANHEWLVLENLKSLVEGGDDSDANFVKAELRKLGYLCETFMMDATACG